MLLPFNFGWQKILPILYDNYMSHTELLNAVILKIHEIIKELNSLAEFVEKLNEKVNAIELDISKLKKDLINLSAELKKLQKQQETDREYLVKLIEDTNSRTLNLVKDIIETNSKEILEKIEKIISIQQDIGYQYDLFGRKRQNPISSVFATLECGVDAEMDGFDLTCEQYDKWSDIYGAYMLDRYGKYILSNNYPSLMRVSLVVKGDTWVQNSDSQVGEITTVLRLVKDRDLMNQIDLLNDRSLENLVIEFSTEMVPPEIQGYTFSGEYYTVGFDVVNKNMEIVDGGIALNATYHNSTYGIYENTQGETLNILIPAVVDFTGITTV